MLGTLGYRADILTTSLGQLQFDLRPGDFSAQVINQDLDIKSVDCVYIRGPKIKLQSSAYAYYLSRYCVWNHIPCINDYSLYYPGTKVAQTLVFMEVGVPFLRTIYTTDKYQLIKYAKATLGYPHVLKASTGSHGNLNYLVRSSQEAIKIINRDPAVDFLAQAYCPNDHDYRLLLAGEFYLLFERRSPGGSYLHNTSKGGIVRKTNHKLPTAIMKGSRDIADKLKLMIAGVDIIQHIETRELFFLEINSQPQLRTGALTEDKKALLRQFFNSCGKD